MLRAETGRAIAGLTTVIAALAGVLVIATQAWGGNGGIGEDPPPTPTDPAPPSDGVFPLAGKYTWGDGFGAGRDHQGQDLITRCGKRVVSAHSGRVQMVDSHSAAGNFVVIDGEGALEDTVYAHLAARPALRKRQRVFAGDAIGRVGDTGNASTCHLHFELWSNPGYYEGGEAIDPEPTLRAWARAKRRG